MLHLRKVAPFPPDIRARIQAVLNTHESVPRPEGVGRKVVAFSGQRPADQKLRFKVTRHARPTPGMAATLI